MRLAIFRFYGKGQVACACCGEPQYEFLSIDHIAGGGSKHRREHGMTGHAFYRWLIKEGFPDGYRVLCHNCNMAKGFYGVCPHEVRQPVS